jgi:hypothetical protein
MIACCGLAAWLSNPCAISRQPISVFQYLALGEPTLGHDVLVSSRRYQLLAGFDEYSLAEASHGRIDCASLAQYNRLWQR